MGDLKSNCGNVLLFIRLKSTARSSRLTSLFHGCTSKAIVEMCYFLFGLNPQHKMVPWWWLYFLDWVHHVNAQFKLPICCK
uniref:Uncharacterized protein n=1 Tax=Manihot esculenta TaxID=3983 RepID=A0A251IPR6_MANES